MQCVWCRGHGTGCLAKLTRRRPMGHLPGCEALHIGPDTRCWLCRSFTPGTVCMQWLSPKPRCWLPCRGASRRLLRARARVRSSKRTAWTCGRRYPTGVASGAAWWCSACFYGIASWLFPQGNGRAEGCRGGFKCCRDGVLLGRLAG